MHTTYQPHHCWHCESRHKGTSFTCLKCGGATLPTIISASMVEWNIFEIKASDSDEHKENQLRAAKDAIDSNQYVAILGFKLSNGLSKPKKAVYRHLPTDDGKLPYSGRRTGRQLSFPGQNGASQRTFEKVMGPDWESFLDILGLKRSHFPLPDEFPMATF